MEYFLKGEMHLPLISALVQNLFLHSSNRDWDDLNHNIQQLVPT